MVPEFVPKPCFCRVKLTSEWLVIRLDPESLLGEHLRKGSRIYVEGRKCTESWDDKRTCDKHYRDLIYADGIEFLDSRGNGNGHGDPAESVSDETTVTNQDVPF